jgi:hypothetical protein
MGQQSQGFCGYTAENLLPPIVLVLDVSGEIYSASDNSSLPVESQLHKGVRPTRSSPTSFSATT